MKPTAIRLKDVAEKAGVSRSTVSRVFADNGASLSRKTRKRVMRVANEMGYRPSFIARGLATNKTRLIGLVVSDFQNPVYMDIFNSFTNEIQRRGFCPLLVNLSGETDPQKAAQLLHRYNVDGVIFAAPTMPFSFVDAFHKRSIPVIHTFGKFDPEKHVSTVGIDNFECGEMAAGVIHKRGYRKIAVIGGPRSATTTRDRVTGFQSQAQKLGMIVSALTYADDNTYEAGQRAMRDICGPGSCEFSAVFCSDDLICIGAMDVAKKMGCAIADELGFLGVNDMKMASWDSYKITSLRLPIEGVVFSSVELIEQILNESVTSVETRLFRCELVERGSLPAHC